MNLSEKKENALQYYLLIKKCSKTNDSDEWKHVRISEAHEIIGNNF